MPIFLFAHVILWKQSWDISWWFISDAAADFMTVLVIGAVSLLLGSGAWTDVSILREYANRDDAFWREAQVHVALAFGSLAAATLVGVPLGIVYAMPCAEASPQQCSEVLAIPARTVARAASQAVEVLGSHTQLRASARSSRY